MQIELGSIFAQVNRLGVIGWKSEEFRIHLSLVWFSRISII